MPTTTSSRTEKSGASTSRIAALGGQALAAGKTTGVRTLDLYETAVGRVADLQRQAAGRAPIPGVGALVGKQADLLVTLTRTSTAPVRRILK